MRAYIPPNLDDNGKVFGGLIGKQNAIETGVYLGLIFLLVKLLGIILDPVACVVIFIILGVPGSVVLITGIDGKSVFTVLVEVIKYNSTKGVYTLGMPTRRRKK